MSNPEVIARAACLIYNVRLGGMPPSAIDPKGNLVAWRQEEQNMARLVYPLEDKEDVFSKLLAIGYNLLSVSDGYLLQMYIRGGVSWE